MLTYLTVNKYQNDWYRYRCLDLKAVIVKTKIVDKLSILSLARFRNIAKPNIEHWWNKGGGGVGVQERERQGQEVASLRASREAASTRERDLQDKLNTLRNSFQKEKQAI